MSRPLTDADLRHAFRALPESMRAAILELRRELYTHGPIVAEQADLVVTRMLGDLWRAYTVPAGSNERSR